jgi:hypothetical protein
MNMSRDGDSNKAIESAVERGTPRPGQAQPGMGERQERVDQALRQRLQQLRTAMGDESQPAAQATDFAAPNAPPPFVPIPMPALESRGSPPVAARAPQANRQWVWPAAALVLGGLTWYALNSETGGFDAPPPTAAKAEAAAPNGSSVVSPPATPTVEPLKATSATPAPEEPTANASAPAATVPMAVSAQVASTHATEKAPPDPSQQLRGLVESWRQAWSDRDTESYLGFYGSAFEPGKGLSLSQWKASRYRNVGGKTDIQVQISDLQVSLMDERQARITFLQDYASGNYRESAQPKTLIVAREGDAWRILKEWQGDESY